MARTIIKPAGASSTPSTTKKLPVVPVGYYNKPALPNGTGVVGGESPGFFGRAKNALMGGSIEGQKPVNLSGLVKSEIESGKDIAAAVGGNLMSGSVEKANSALSDSDLEYVKTISGLRQKAAQDGKDTSHWDNLIKNYKTSTGISMTELFPALEKSNAQVIGDFAGMAVDVLAAGSYGKAAAGAQTGNLLSSKAAPVAATTATTLGEKLTDVGIKTAKNTAMGGALGYGYDVSKNLQEGETGSEAFTPGMGTVFGTVIPAGLGAVEAGIEITKATAPRIINSLIKPLSKDFSYGKDPGRTVSAEGITGNTMDDLYNNITKKRKEIGSNIGAESKLLDGKIKLDVNDAVSPIDDAMNAAAKNNNSSLVKRLANVKQSLQETLVLDVKLPKEAVTTFTYNTPMQLKANGLDSLADDIAKIDTTKVKTAADLKDAIINTLGEDAFYQSDINAWFRTATNLAREASPGSSGTNIISVGKKTLDNMDYTEALKLKSEIGDITQWTDNHSDDEVVNAALKKVYGKINEKMSNAAETVSPEIAKRLSILNEKYGDLMSAEIATKYRDKILKRQNLISMPATVGTATGIITAVATGGAAIPAILAGATAAALDKALGTAAVKSRVAAWLGKESPTVIRSVFQNNPAIQTVMLRAFPKLGSMIETK